MRIKQFRFQNVQGAISLLGFLLYLFFAGYTFSLTNLDLSFLTLNVLCLSILYFFILFISGRTDVTFLFSTVVIFLINYVDRCVFTARLTHLRLTDFVAASQAMRVASHYELIWTRDQWIQLLLIVCMSLFLFVIQRAVRLKWKPFQSRVMSGSLLLLLLLILIEGTYMKAFPIPGKYSGFDANMTVEEAGLIGSWYSQLINRKYEKPDGYDREKANSILAKYADSTEIIPAESVNLIVIMNESLTDYTLFGETAFEDTLPFIHQMVESGEMFEGKLAASVLGGGTCNTEWEFLTGNSLMFLPNGVYAFMSYVSHDSESIARELEPLGYHSTFFHPYYSQEWNRQAVYSFMGFDSFMAGDSIGKGLINKDEIDNVTESLFKKTENESFNFGDDLEYIRKLISDSQAYEILLGTLSLNNGNPNDFMFCVTIQNHGGYSYQGDDFNSRDYVEGVQGRKKYLAEIRNGEYSSNPELVNQYLTLSALSDSAFRELIDSLSGVEEKTMVVMFGDHQPAINISDYISYNDTIHQSVSEENYVVPYIVWCNYDNNYEFPDYISANFLSTIIKDSIGLPLTAWDKYRLDVMKKYPVMTSHFVLDQDHTLVTNTDTKTLNEYACVQYMRMFEHSK